MLKLLATLRRFFLAGTISLIIILVFYDKNISPGLVYPYSDYVGGWYLLFAFFSPIFAILFWVISSIYIPSRFILIPPQSTYNICLMIWL